jgi:hypothetical protein
VLGSYRGRQARIPPAALDEVLIRLGRAAREIGQLPPRGQGGSYRRLAAALEARGLTGAAASD